MQAEGAAAQLRSSDIFELNQRLNFFKKISLFHGSLGFYLVMTIMAYRYPHGLHIPNLVEPYNKKSLFDSVRSISLYVLTLLLFSLAGIGLQELGELGSVYSTELAIALGFICITFCAYTFWKLAAHVYLYMYLQALLYRYR